MTLRARPSILPPNEKVCDNIGQLASKLLKISFYFSQMPRDQQLIDVLTQRIRYCDAFIAALGLMMLSATPAGRQELGRIADFVNGRRQIYEEFRMRLSM